MSIGIELTGRGDVIRPEVFLRAISSFLDLVRDVDSVISTRQHGSITWSVSLLSKNSPALFAIEGKSKLRQGDFTSSVQYSVVNGLCILNERPEQPDNFSYGALKNIRTLSVQAGKLSGIQLFDDGQRVEINQTVRNNVENLLGFGSESLGSVRGKLDALTVHTGHEFRIWPSVGAYRGKTVTCRFKKNQFEKVIQHLRGEVEVVGRLRRNAKGVPVFISVHDFVPLEPPKYSPTIEEMSGLVKDLYSGASLEEYLKELRNG